eukprot:m.26258 g.26258  ORF g.26258 m.26258 type:complete len:116 (-) comp15333_c0_seq1:152-499(-)
MFTKVVKYVFPSCTNLEKTSMDTKMLASVGIPHKLSPPLCSVSFQCCVIQMTCPRPMLTLRRSGGKTEPDSSRAFDNAFGKAKKISWTNSSPSLPHSALVVIEEVEAILESTHFV